GGYHLDVHPTGRVNDVESREYAQPRTAARRLRPPVPHRPLRFTAVSGFVHYGCHGASNATRRAPIPRLLAAAPSA
ncbi:MAG: hypothetical protein LC799_32640, partial [Actinobacteria bacterium]|nr:hypothetical protein [Actinomycetota bacterium]